MFSKILKNHNKERGFTLIELVVVFSVIALISTVGIASFVSYSRTQSIQTAYLDLLNNLNLARSYSISQNKPASCGNNDLSGYQVVIDPNGTNTKTHGPGYFVVVKCGSLQPDYGNCSSSDICLKAVTFPKNVAFKTSLTTLPNNAVLFPILTNNVSDCSSTCTITMSGYGSDQRSITIDGLGIIRGQNQ